MNKRNPITNLLNEIGIPANLRGRDYIKSAVRMIVKDPQIIHGKLGKEVYPEVAKEFGVNQQCVERSIRHAIERAWLEGNMEALQALFGNTVSFNRGKPTNAEFLGMLAEYLRGD